MSNYQIELIIVGASSAAIAALLVFLWRQLALRSVVSNHKLEMHSIQSALATAENEKAEQESISQDLRSEIDSIRDEHYQAKTKIVALEANQRNSLQMLEERKRQLEDFGKRIRTQADELTQKARLEETKTSLTHRVESLEQSLTEKDDKIQSLMNEIRDKEQRISTLDTKLNEQAEYNRKASKAYEETKLIMQQEFKSLAVDVLEQKSKDFRSQHQESLEGILKPFKAEIAQFKSKVEAGQKEDISYRAQLSEEFKQLKMMNQKITDDADNLAKALKGEKKLQGNWGEMQLEKILETSGLIKGQEYEREPNFKTEEGKNQRPDFIVKLPEGKHLIIDSKVSLNDFVEYSNAESAEEQQLALVRHVDAVKNHIKSLNDKDYPTLTGLQSPDFVFMFMPIEPAFNVALQNDFRIFDDAFAKHIVIVTPTTLLATLKTVASIWTIERQNKKSAELADMAGGVYDKLRGFLEKMEKLEGNLVSARNSFDDAMKTLRTGNGNLVSKAENFKALGVRVKKDISSSMLDKSELSDVKSITPTTLSLRRK